VITLLSLGLDTLGWAGRGQSLTYYEPFKIIGAFELKKKITNH
jgi:hypothetical protein